jgi:solute carrier family 31 (copper transporter), member 1
MDMSSTMSMTTSATATTYSMSMATSSASSSMDMDMGMMPASEMMMTFFTGTSTALFSESWIPSSASQYAGTCIFLIVLSTIFRALVAVRCNFSEVMAYFEKRRDPEGIIRLEDPTKCGVRRSWGVNEAIARAGLDMVLAGLGYLL